MGNCGVCHTMAVSGHTQQGGGTPSSMADAWEGCRRKRVLKQRITKCTFPPRASLARLAQPGNPWVG